MLHSLHFDEVFQCPPHVPLEGGEELFSQDLETVNVGDLGSSVIQQEGEGGS